MPDLQHLLRRQEIQVFAPDPESMSQTDEANVMNAEAGYRLDDRVPAVAA